MSKKTLARIQPADWQVLQLLHRLGATPQHRLAEHLGRQRSTMNGAVQRLLAAGWIAKAGKEAAGRGRPAILLAVDRSAGCFAGIDIAADDIHCALVGVDGALLDQASSRLGVDRGLHALLDQVDLTLRGLLSRADLRVEDLLGLWAGINGPVDDHGVVVSCASLGWHNVDLRGELIDRYGENVLVQGGAAVMNAFAESLMGAGRDAGSLVYFHAGRGISARFVERRQPLRGYTQRAGELGHVVVAPDGPVCACGNRGCLEAVASGPAIVAAVRHIPRDDCNEALRAVLAAEEGPRTRDVVRTAVAEHAGDGGPIDALLANVTRYLAMGASMAVAAYDPEVLVLGGYLLDDNAPLRLGIENALQRMVLDWGYTKHPRRPGEVLTQNRAVGGAAEVCQRFWAAPRGIVGET
jgi:predicted NBD/HSP70 family sugar kinase